MTEANIIPAHKPPIVVLREKLQDPVRREELKAALVDVDPDHFIRTVITAATINPELQACSFQSLWNACMRACRDQLLPDGREGAIVPFKDRAQWIPMYQGFLKRFRQSGECKWLTANVVRKGEAFTHYIDQTGEHFHHIPDGDEKEPIIKVYAAALTKDGAFYVAVMSMSEIEQIKKESRANRPDSPWQKWPGEMMKKTAIRRLAKLLPIGRDLIAEEESSDVPVPLPPLPTVERNPGAAASLEQFAGGTTRPASDGESDGGSVAPAADPANHLSIAYERGRIAKETGAQRRAVPGEYREENTAAELEAWLAGYDGKEPGHAEGAA